MIRRRRPAREIAFSFDSFLDVVANVVGIIIRLILVVWVGARSYSSLQTKPALAAPAANVSTAGEPEDPLRQELTRHRRELADVQAKLLEQLQQLQQLQTSQAQAQRDLAAVSSQRGRLERERADLDGRLIEKGKETRAATLSLAELRQRGERLTAEIRALQKLPPLSKTLHYRTPVSQPVHSEELLFECRRGRVTFIDINALLADVRRGFDDKGKTLRSQWQVSDVTPPVGAFRLRYVIERERSPFDAIGATGTPDSGGSYRYSLGSWELEPVILSRGETLETALAPDSDFRQAVDGLDPQQTVVTFWVYPDSFALYRRLRDYLYDRDVVVAGRPLPEGVPIASSRRGSVSRGQ